MSDKPTVGEHGRLVRALEDAERRVGQLYAALDTDAEQQRIYAEQLAEAQQQVARLRDAAEMLWVVLANVSGGDWSLQSAEWQEVAARWRDEYFAALAATRPKQEQG